jgi:hypothetical protein
MQVELWYLEDRGVRLVKTFEEYQKQGIKSHLIARLLGDFDPSVSSCIRSTRSFT